MMHEMGLGVVVSMRDMFTRNSHRIQSAMMSLDATVAASSTSLQRNMQLVQRGMMMVGAGLALLAIPAIVISSTVATQKALGEMASLGVKDLKSLSAAAEEFSNTWGGTSKAAFIAAAYDIKSGIASLTDAAVGEYTQLAALTAKATKATVAEMTSLFATGYGIYRRAYGKLSDFEFGEMFSGGIAASVQAFKTTGSGMAAAISGLGASATTANIPLEEQLSILGMLQATMSGAEAGTKYRAFLKSAAEAGKELNLGFVDQNNNLLGMAGILKKLRERYGDILDAMEKMEIQKAFGRAEAVAVVDLFYDRIGDLTGNIRSMSSAMRQGTRLTLEMAQAMNLDIGSQMALVGQQLHNLFEILGELLLPVVTPILRGVSRVILYFQRLAKSSPRLTRAVLVLAAALGSVLVAVGGVLAAAGTVGLLLPAIKAGFVAIGAAIGALASVIAAKLLPITLIIVGIVAAVYLLRKAWQTNFGGIRDFVVSFATRVKLVFQGVWQLFSSLSSGTGRISAELVGKLKAMGLWGFVKTVFMVYYRVREYLAGLWQAYVSAFRKIVRIVEPAVRALLNAYRALYGALFSVFEALGLVSSTADGSAFRSLGTVIGTVLGVIAQAGAYVIRYLVYPLTWMIHLVALVVRAVVWLVKVIVQGAVHAAKFLYKFALPFRLLVNSIIAVVQIAYTLWQVLTGEVSVVDALKKIGGAIFDYLATPFLWIRDTAVGIWSLIRRLFAGLLGFFRWAGGLILSAIASLPIVRTLVGIWRNIRAFFAGDKTFFQAGKGILLALGKGILSVITWPYRMVKKAFGWVARLLPFSDAQEGPLSRLTAAGAAIIRTLCNGILSLATLPLRIIAGVFRSVLDVARAIWSGVKNVVRAGWELVKGVGSLAVSILTAPFRAALSVGRAIWSGVKDVAAAGWAAVKGVGSAAWSVVSAPFRLVGRAASAAWSGVKSAASSAWSGMKAMASGAAGLLTAPFRGLRSAASGAWDWVARQAASAVQSVKSVASAGWQGVKSVASTAYQAGKSVLTTVAKGAKAVVTAPYRVAKSAFGFVRSLLPFSDAKEGPLSRLTEAGRAILETVAGGMQRVLQLPADMFAKAWGFLAGPGAGGAAPDEPQSLIGRWIGTLGQTLSGLVSQFTGGFGLSPAFAGVTAGAAASAGKPVPTVVREREVEQRRILAERVTTITGAPSAAPAAAGQASPMSELLAKLDELGDRPVEVNITVVSKLDGRAVAQAVYRNIRQEKVRNYETL
ncbi:MAG: phage tail tape measure protein [Planctomycetota bacterium]